MMITIELSEEDWRLIATMIPKARVLREDAMRAALGFLEALDQAGKEAGEAGHAHPD